MEEAPKTETSLNSPLDEEKATQDEVKTVDEENATAVSTEKSVPDETGVETTEAVPDETNTEIVSQGDSAMGVIELEEEQSLVEEDQEQREERLSESLVVEEDTNEDIVTEEVSEDVISTEQDELVVEEPEEENLEQIEPVAKEPEEAVGDSLTQSNVDSSGVDANETVFEEVDANVSAEKVADVEETDMLGESDLTVPEEGTAESVEVTEDKPSPMEVDNTSGEDVEMASPEAKESSEEKESEKVTEPEQEHEVEETDITQDSSKVEGDVIELMETESEANEIATQGEDVVDQAVDKPTEETLTEETETITKAVPGVEEEHGDEVDHPPDKDAPVSEIIASEVDEEQPLEEAVSEKAAPENEPPEKEISIAEDEPVTNCVPEEAETPTAREDDADPDVENVQEPEESDVCLIPDTENEMTDAEKERAIQARENAEKETDMIEETVAEKDTSDPAIEEPVQEPLLEELLPSEQTLEAGTPHKTIIYLAVSAKHKCIQCDETKICGYRYKDADKTTTDYLCEMACVDNLLAANPGKFFLRRKKFLVDEVLEEDIADHKCLQCRKNKSTCKYFFKQDDDTFYICSEDCYKTLSTDEPEKFNMKRDSIRVRNIGHTTISSKRANNTDTRIVSRSAIEAEAARVERATSFLRRCSECLLEIQLRVGNKNLVWQTMDFCDELCLGKYQRRIGSQCQTCHGEVPHQSLGKYCVRFGFEIRQFCCASCLNNFKKGLKTCSCCQKDISGSGEGFLAPVGDKEQFKDFCSQSCMRHYDSMCNAKKKLRTDRCAVCNFEKPMRVEMTIDGKEQNFCSNPCFSAFKFVSNIVPDQCGMCSKYFERKSGDSHTIYGEKQRPKVFCSRICFNVYIIVNRQITSCQWCKVKKYDFDMIVKSAEQRNVMMCSLNCLTLYGVSINAFSRTAIKCDNCNSCTTPQYHLTMSDASMRNFCTYQCVMQFQSQFARVPLTLDSEAVATATHHVSSKQQGAKNSGTTTTPFPTGLPKRVKLNTNQINTTGAQSPATTKNQNNQVQIPVVPVISNVASLATGQTETLIGSTTVRRGLNRGRQRGRPRLIAPAPPRLPAPTVTSPPPPPPPSIQTPPTTRTRSAVSPILAASTQASASSSKTHQRGGRTSTRSSASTETPRPATPIIEKQIETKIVTVPPYPPMVRNVQTSCRPKTENVSIDCKPETAEIGIQTEEDYSSKILIPVPVPIYIPQPMYMYSAPFPVPVPIPLPIPVPIFIPTTRNSSNGILKEIKKIQDKMPADPFEAELLMMAEMVADEKNESDSDSEEETKPEPRMLPVQYSPPPAPTNNVVSMESQNNTSFGDDVLHIAFKMASGEYEEPGVDLESAMTANTITHPPPGMVQSTHVGDDLSLQMGHHLMMESNKGSRGRKRGALASPITPRNNRSPIKRQRLSSENPPLQQPVQVVEKPDVNMCLKFTFGVNAWKQWVMTKNADIEKSSVRRRLFKTELLQMTADELNYSLCLFVKEVRKPNGTEYAPDTIYYLVLGIQQYLYENGRIDNIFTDPYYERFTDCLDEVARKFSVLYNDSQYIVTRVEEEHLWECKQLGAHSPHVLLSTLMFFNTKHFNLTTVEEHMQLSFSHIMKHWKRSATNAKSPGTRNVLLRFYPPQAGLDANPRKKKVYEQQENEENPLRCPVRLYEFYLSKCPESVKTRNDVFYLQPERSCVPDSPVWYSTQALSQEALQKMLHRVKMVKEINIALLTS